MFPHHLSDAEVDALAAGYRDACGRLACATWVAAVPRGDANYYRDAAVRYQSIAAAAGWRLQYVDGTTRVVDGVARDVDGRVRVWHACRPEDWRWAR